MKSTKSKMSRRNKGAPPRHQPDTTNLSKNDDGYKEQVQLEEEIQEVGTKMASYETSVVQMEDKKTGLTEQMQGSTMKNEDLDQQLQKIRDMEQTL